MRLAASALLAALLTLSACTPPGDDGAPWNVVVVLVDTLRSDHVGAYGYARPTTPRLDALAAESVLFENARAQAPCTFPSTNSALTSRDPAYFLDQPQGHMGIPEAIPSVAEMLRHRGYDTYAVSASPIVRATPTKFNQAGGFGRGFDAFDEACEWREAACVHRAAVELLRWRTDDRPFFLYLHYMDPHDPYRPPESEPRLFAKPYSGDKSWVHLGDPNPLADMVYNGNDAISVTDEELTHLEDLYDDEIHYFDRHLGMLLDELEHRRLLERTLLVVMSDHGESFLEANHVKHCRSLYDREVKTPLVLRVPGLAPRRVATPVANLDLVPTILDYVDQRLPPPAEGEPALAAPPDLEGASLRPLAEGTGERLAADGGAPVVFSAIGVWRAAADDRFKLIHNLRDDTWALYDLAADPAEMHDVLADNRRAFHRLRDAMQEWMDRVEEGGDAEATDEALQRLKALGYLQ
jgi:arylsulfatase